MTFRENTANSHNPRKVSEPTVTLDRWLLIPASSLPIQKIPCYST